MKLSIIIPVYNEENTIQEVLNRVLRADIAGMEKEVIIIDDGSKDGTRSILVALEDPFRVVLRERREGKGAAVQEGLALASGDIVLIQDADLEYDPREYVKLLTPFLKGEADVVYGSRNLAKNPVYSPLFYWGGRAITAFANILYGSSLTDLPTGYKVFRKDLIRGCAFREKGFEFCEELTAKFLKKGVNIREVPISYSPRTKKEGKKLKWIHGLRAVKTLVRERMHDDYKSFRLKEFVTKKGKAVSTILMVTSIFPPDIGGPSYYAQNLAGALRKLGVAPRVLAGGESRSFLKIFCGLTNANICYIFSSSPKIFVPAFFAAKLRGKKIAIRIGGDFLWERSMESGRTDLPLSLFYSGYTKTFGEKLIFFFLRFLLRRCDMVIFTSCFLTGFYKNFYKISPEKMFVIENPYPSARGAKRAFPDQDFAILYAGRLIRLKNIETLIRAVKKVRDQAGARISLNIFGEGPEEQNLRNLIQELALTESVVMEKSLSQQNLFQEIKRAALVVVPSFSEVTPNLALESVALGTPVIVTKESGLPKDFMRNFIVFDPQNTEELSFAIISLLKKNRWCRYQEAILNIDTSRNFSVVAEEHTRIFNGQRINL